MAFVVIAALVFVPMLVEAVRAANNERAQLSRGGIEPPHDVYRVMRVAYPAAFVLMVIEGLMRGTPRLAPLAAGAVIFAVAKLIKWSAIRALGPSWTFRVIVVPGAPLVASGPYRYLRHPNYVGVVGELIGIGLMTEARITGPLVTLVFSALLVRRLAVEERALGSAAE